MASAIGPAIGAIGSIAGGIAGQNAAAGDRGDARNAAITQSEILAKLKDAPDISKPLILEQYKQAGILTPEMQQNIIAQMPAAISTDPRLKTAQMQALDQMQKRASQGLTQGDRAALNQAQLQTQGDTKSRLASIQQQMAQQGQASGGAALAMKLAAAQNESNQMATNADQQAQISQQAREQALSNLGQYGTQLQSQDFGQQLAQQQAKDQMQRFNIQNQLGVQAANVGANNQAQASNLQNLQNVNNANVGNQNQELNNQLSREMQQYGADVNTAQIKAGGQGNLSNYLQNAGNQTAQSYANMGSGIGQAFSGAAGAAAKPSTPAKAAWEGGKMDFKGGGSVPGKAPVTGDSPANDIVHAVLSPGEIVIPRTLSESKFGKHILKIIDAHNTLKKHMNGEDNGQG